MHSKNIYYCHFCFLLLFLAFAQQENLPLNRNMILNYEKSLNAFDKPIFHTAVKPYQAAQVYEFVYPDTVQHFERIPHTNWFSKFVNVFGYENLIEFDDKRLC